MVIYRFFKVSCFITGVIFTLVGLTFFSCTKSGGDNTPDPSDPLPSNPPTLNISPGLSINIPYNSAASFSWTTNGVNVKVNGVANPGNSFTTPALTANTNYSVTSYSPTYAADGLSTSAQVSIIVEPAPVEPHVYCAGYDNGAMVYWKDTVMYTLALGSSVNCGVNGIALQGTDVYVVGYFNSSATYWKNGVAVNLVNGRVVTQATSIAIDGADVYIGGQDVAPIANLAVYWKNGNPVILTGALQDASVDAITVSGGNVYAAGFIGDSAVIWINGVRTTLSNGYARARGIAVVGSDVYVTGTENGNAVYWKNGVRTILPNIAVATGNAIMVLGTDVYVAGIDDSNKAVYWKNGVKTPLATIHSFGSAICQFNGDIYIAGLYGSAAVYWKNGIKKTLPGTSVFSKANGIVVVQ